MKNIWISKKKPLLVLAPMAGCTDSAFRMLCREYGADITMTELISADAIAYGKLKVYKVDKVHKVEGKNQNTAELLNFDDRERPLVVQLFGKYPEKFAIAAKWITEELKPDGIDINMGCPARKVVGSDHGAALLKDHDLAVKIVKAVKANTNLPVSVKTRLGWEKDDEILEFAPKLIEAGVDALIIHGRTYKDGFKNVSRWENIYKLKSELLNPKFETNSKFKIQNSKVSIIGNGDIHSYEEAIEKSKSGDIQLDGVAIGRASFGCPEIFSSKKLPATSYQLSALILRHATLNFETKGEHGIIEFRKHLLSYLKGFPGAKEMRTQAVAVATVEDVKKIIDRIG